MKNDGVLLLRLIDVQGKPLGEPVDIILDNQRLGQRLVAKQRVAAKPVRISELHSGPNGLYRILIDPPSYLPVSRFVNVTTPAKPIAITFPVDPEKVSHVKFPAYQELPSQLTGLLERSRRVLGFEGQDGTQLYGSLDDIRRAGMLNISAKATAVTFRNGRQVTSYFGELREIRGDRFFVAVTKELREETKNSIDSALFNQVSGALHHPPLGFASAGSFKTSDRYGNLQLSFWCAGDDWVADVDIDDADGIEHLFQVLRNHLTARPTHPYNIHQILVAHQQIDPGYTFEV